jgi:hypothetical protein
MLRAGSSLRSGRQFKEYSVLRFKAMAKVASFVEAVPLLG